MTNEKLNEFMKQIDKIKKPKHWQKFVNIQSEEHNIILKYGKRAFCTHCQKYFDNDIKIHHYIKAKCPYCNKKYYVRNNNIKNFVFSKEIAFYCKINQKIVLRIYELESVYNHYTRKFENSTQEYLRFIPTLRYCYK